MALSGDSPPIDYKIYCRMNLRVSTLVILAGVMLMTSSRHHNANQEAQYAQLINQQSEFEKQLGTIEANMATTMAKLASAASSAEKIGILEKEITNERQLVFSSTKTLLPAFNLSKCSCENLTPDQKQSVINELENVRGNIVTLQKDLHSAPSCARTKQMYLDLNAQLYFIEHMQNILRSKCDQRAVLSPTIWQTNLMAQNWVTGDQTFDDIIEQYYQRSITYDNITNCDLKTPFFSEGKCIACTEQLPIFDLYRGVCVRCDDGFVFDGAARSCVKGIVVKQRDCPAGTYYDRPSDTCIKLVKCESNQFFNATARACQDYISCNGQWLDRLTNTCVDFKVCDGQWLDRTNNECVGFQTCPEGFTLNKETNQCDKFIVCNNQFFDINTRTCIDYVKCDLDTEVLNRATNQCDKLPVCGEGQYLDRRTNTCVDVPKCNPATEFFNSVLHKCVPYLTCPEGQFLRKEFNRCEPFVTCSNGILDKETNTCKECPEGQIVDTKTNTCVPRPEAIPKCDPNLVLNTDTKTCVQKPTVYRFNEKANKVIHGKVTAEAYQLQIEKVVRNHPFVITAECPEDKPYSQLTQCIACDDYFILDTQECGKCPDGSEFDADSKTCKVILYLSEAADSKIDLGGSSLSDFTAFQNANVAKNTQAIVRTCPKETPYSVSGTKCISCEEGQAFDPATNACKACANWNADSHKCD